MKRGGWPARQVRLFCSGRVHYEGDLHERLIFDVRQPKIGHLKSPFHHFSHRSVIDNLHKTANYAEIWAAEQKRLDVKPVSAATLYWVYFREIGYRLVWKQGWRDGIPESSNACISRSHSLPVECALGTSAVTNCQPGLRGA